MNGAAPASARSRTAILTRLRPRLLPSLVAATLVAGSVIGFVLTMQSANQQEQALLQSQANQAATYASSALSGVFSTLNSDAAVVTLTHGSPAAFEKAAAVPSPLATVLAKMVGGEYVVTAATGGEFHRGDVLTGKALATVDHAGSDLKAGPAQFNGRDRAVVRFAVGAPRTPSGFVVYEQATFNPFTITPDIAGHAFNDLEAVLYGGPRMDRHDLVLATTRGGRISGSAARARVAVGGSTWLLAADARHSLIGGVAEAAPFVILIVGILMAIVAGVALEVVLRRHRYANALVEERTAELSRSLDELRAAQEALVRGERLTAVGEMATVVGHELRNPLAAVMNGLYLIRTDLGQPLSDVVARNLSMAETEALRAATLAEDLTDFVRPREAEPAPIDSEGFIDELIAATPPPSGTVLVVDVEPFTLVADRGQLAEIATNLVTNAYQAVPQEGAVRIRLGQDGDAARLEVEDNGPGIAEAVADRLFDPFVTTKHKGTGLGLAIVQRLVAAHGGTISYENLEGGGARFTVFLPLEVEAVSA